MKRSSAPVFAASSCHGTRFEWCSSCVVRIASPGPRFARPHENETRLIASVVLRVQMISSVCAALTNAATFARAASKCSVARAASSYTPRWMFALSFS